MGLSQGQIDKLLPGWAEAANEPYKRAQQEKLQRMEQDARLAQLIKGDELKNQAYQRDLETAKSLRQQYGPETSVDAGDVRLGARDPLQTLLRQRELSTPRLTPAQEAAEKTVGKQIADYQAAGGKPTLDKNIQSLKEVQDELSKGKRDRWDRGVGAAFGSLPSLLGIFGSKEKERRDKARNTALTIARQTDPNPTEKQIEAIMGQIYDPASSDQDNQARISRFLAEQQQKSNQMEQASQNYNRTGYATIGGVGAAPAADMRDKVMVISPDGRKGTIPRNNLQKALQKGYKEVK